MKLHANARNANHYIKNMEHNPKKRIKNLQNLRSLRDTKLSHRCLGTTSSNIPIEKLSMKLQTPMIAAIPIR